MTVMAHKWGKQVTEEEFYKVFPPAPKTSTHFPSKFSDDFDLFKEIMGYRDIQIENIKYWLSNDNMKSLIGFKLDHPEWQYTPDYQLEGGLMNSNDCSIASLLGLGPKVFIFDNGAFISEHKLSRKHTKNHATGFSEQVWEVTKEMGNIKTEIFNKFESLKEMDFSSQSEVHDFVVQSCQNRIIPWQSAPKVLEHWNNPEHFEFKDRNGYCLFNAYTSHLRNTNEFTKSKTTRKLRVFFDEFKNIEDSTNLATIGSRPRTFERSPLDFGDGNY